MRGQWRLRSADWAVLFAGVVAEEDIGQEQDTAGVSRFLYATGFSGHGFLQGPAVGEIVRDLVLRRPTVIDIAPLSAERFDATELRPEYNVV